MPGTPQSEDAESSASGPTLRRLRFQLSAQGALFSAEDDTWLSAPLHDDTWRTWVQSVLRGGSSNEGSHGEASYEGSPGERLYNHWSPGAMQYEGSPEETLYEGSPLATPSEGSPRETPYEGSPRETPYEGSLRETPYEGPLRETPYDGSPGRMPNDWTFEEPLYLGSPWTSSTASEASQVQNASPPGSGTSQLHRVGSDQFDTSSRWVNDLPITEWRPSSPDFDSETPPPLHLETPPPLNSEIPPPLHLETPPPLHSEMPPPMHLETPPPLHLDAPLPLDSEIPPPLDSETPPPLDSETLQPLHSETLQLLKSEALPSAPEPHALFNDAMTQKLKNYAVLGAVAGVSMGLTVCVEKLIHKHSHKSQRAGRDLASSGVVGRGTNMHPRPRKNPVSRVPAKSRDEDLRLLSILTRRALERLD